MSLIYVPPTEEFRKGIRGLLEKHFDEKIVEKFILEYEANLYNADKNKNIQAQMKDKNFILEVRYQTSPLTSQYICDVASWWPKNYTEHHLLRFITDKAKTGKIGRDWLEKGGKIGISPDILSGKYETKI